MFTNYRQVKPDVQWVNDGFAFVFFRGRIFFLKQLPNHDWQISHPSIGVQVFQKCGYPVALAFLANR